MMRNRALFMATAASVLTVGLASAQTTGVETANPVTRGLAFLHDSYRDYVVRTAELVPEELYSFRPTQDVRNLGEVLAHIADANYNFCSAAAQQPNPNEESLVRTRVTKEAITAALRASFEYCDGVYERTEDSDLSETTVFMGAPNTRIVSILAGNSAHIADHYGNLVTYMRLNGIIPPSSNRR